MPIPTIEEARDEILDLFTTQWNTQGSPPLIVYDDKERDLPANAPYVRIMVEHNISNQATIGGRKASGGGGQRFRRFGIVTVQIFTPFGDGLTDSDPLVDFVMDIFEGESTGSDRIEFRDVRPNEVGQNGAWHQTNVLAEFNYDRLK